MQISGNDDRFIIYFNLLGSFLALIFTIALHYPLIPMFSKNINQRTENEVVALRRSYAIQVLYTIIIGFFITVFIMFLGNEDKERTIYFVATSASLMVVVFALFTFVHMKKMHTVLYVDKQQHRNADIEG